MVGAFREECAFGDDNFVAAADALIHPELLIYFASLRHRPVIPPKSPHPCVLCTPADIGPNWSGGILNVLSAESGYHSDKNGHSPGQKILAPKASGSITGQEVPAVSK